MRLNNYIAWHINVTLVQTVVVESNAHLFTFQESRFGGHLKHWNEKQVHQTGMRSMLVDTHNEF